MARYLEISHFEAYLIKRGLTCLYQAAEMEAHLLDKLSDKVPLINPHLIPLTINDLLEKVNKLYPGLSAGIQNEETQNDKTTKQEIDKGPGQEEKEKDS